MNKFLDEYKVIMDKIDNLKNAVDEEEFDNIDIDGSVLRLRGYMFELKFNLLDRIEKELMNYMPDSCLIYYLSRSYDLLGGIDFSKPYDVSLEE